MRQEHDQVGTADDDNVGRRDALKKIGVGAGVAWSAPVAMSFFSQAAAGTPEPTTTTMPPELPMCRGATCQTFEPCSVENLDCVCVKTADGGLCVPGSTSCQGLELCGPQGACPPGSFCATGTCCGPPVCVPLSLLAQCPPTIGGRRVHSESVRASTGAGTLGG